MLIVQQITGLILAGFSVVFMLWFLVNLVRESRISHLRDARPPIEEPDSWHVRNPGPQPPSSSIRAPRSSGKLDHRPEAQFGQSSRSLRTANR